MNGEENYRNRLLQGSDTERVREVTITDWLGTHCKPALPAYSSSKAPV